MISSAQEEIDQEKEKNFEDAQGFCEREGGNLITVSGEDINKFLVVNGLEYVYFSVQFICMKNLRWIVSHHRHFWSIFYSLNILFYVVNYTSIYSIHTAGGISCHGMHLVKNISVLGILPNICLQTCKTVTHRSILEHPSTS